MDRKNMMRAATMLKNECKVIPEKYTMYNGAYLFLAYPPNVKDKSRVLSPWYLVDLKDEAVGPFSPAFDLNGFFKATEHMYDV